MSSVECSQEESDVRDLTEGEIQELLQTDQADWTVEQIRKWLWYLGL
jgi:hypothetical protein